MLLARSVFFILVLLLSVPLRAQEDIIVGQRYSLYSDILGENREFMVYLPDNYRHSTSQDYRVVYLLDAQTFYVSTVGMMQSLSSMKDKREESTIVVGVVSGDRTLDFTPSASNHQRNGLADATKEKMGGGAEMFHRFIVEELMPRIDATYPNGGKEILVGHSYSALFAIYSMINHEGSFDGYIAIDPSLWWDSGRLVDEAAEQLSGNEMRSLYIGLSAKKRTDRTDDIIAKVTQKFLALLNTHSETINYKFKTYPDENHGTVALPGIYDGLKFIITQ